MARVPRLSERTQHLMSRADEAYGEGLFTEALRLYGDVMELLAQAGEGAAGEQSSKAIQELHRQVRDRVKALQRTTGAQESGFPSPASSSVSGQSGVGSSVAAASESSLGTSSEADALLRDLGIGPYGSNPPAVTAPPAGGGPVATAESLAPAGGGFALGLERLWERIEALLVPPSSTQSKNQSNDGQDESGGVDNDVEFDVAGSMVVVSRGDAHRRIEMLEKALRESRREAAQLRRENAALKAVSTQHAKLCRSVAELRAATGRGQTAERASPHVRSRTHELERENAALRTEIQRLRKQWSELEHLARDKIRARSTQGTSPEP